MESKHTIYVICGPTAVGKSAVAMELATRLGTAIVSADSRQCYKGMDIGTARPSNADMALVPHYFVNAFPYTQNISAADYEMLATEYLKGIFKTNNTAVVCGGTGLYIKALCEGLDEMPEVDTEVDKQVNDTYKAKGITWLQDEIKVNDPLFYETGEIMNPMRLVRALVFKLSTGQSILDYRTGTKKERHFRVIKIGLELPREVLYAQINQRVGMMMRDGLLKEAEGLYPDKELKNLQTVGYAELFDYMDGLYTLEEAIEKIKQNTRKYAKRQMTWFKKDKEVVWMPADGREIVAQILALNHG